MNGLDYTTSKAIVKTVPNSRKGRKKTVILMQNNFEKQFLLVIDWLNPYPQGSRDGFSYELFDTREELMARAQELMEFKKSTNNPEGWKLPGRAHHVVALKLVGSVVENDNYGTAVAYEAVATLWGTEVHDRWIVKEWATEEEWKSFGSAVDKCEAYYRNRDGLLTNISFGWVNYEAIIAVNEEAAC